MIAARQVQQVQRPAKKLPLEEPILGLELDLERCERTRVSIHPQTFKRITLQCVEDPGHGGACMYENPSNKKRK
jgi:hypothetical protein